MASNRSSAWIILWVGAPLDHVIVDRDMAQRQRSGPAPRGLLLP
jgi:hypothetical protein